MPQWIIAGDKKKSFFCVLKLGSDVMDPTMIHYLKNKVGVVDFANGQGLAMF